MNLIITTLLAAAAVASSNAELVAIQCNVTVLKPWVLSTQPGVTPCFTATGYESLSFAVPIFDAFCPNVDCRTMVMNTLAVRPVTDDCYTFSSGTKFIFYESIVKAFANTCASVPTNAPTTTVPPPPVTTPPPPPAPTPPPPSC